MNNTDNVMNLEQVYFQLFDGNVDGDGCFVDLHFFEANNDKKPELNMLFMKPTSLYYIRYTPQSIDEFMKSLSTGIYTKKLKIFVNYLDGSDRRKSYIVE